MRRRVATALLLSLLLLLAPACAVKSQPVPVQAAAAVPEAGRLPIDPALRVGRLANGLTYFVRENRKPEQRAELRLFVNAGSILEDDSQQGLAHFVEHMAFNGTEHFAKHELVDFLETIGMRFGPDVNAFTSFDETVYMLTVPTDDPELVDSALLILHDWASGLSFDDAEIDKERGVVLEERRLGRGAGARMLDEQLPIVLKDSLYARRLPIGKEEVLSGAPHEELRRFYHDWYRPDLLAVAAVGDFDADAIEKKIRKRFAKLGAPERARPRELYPVPDHAETLFAIATDPEATSSSVTVYYKLEKSPQGTEQDYRRELVAELHHEMLNDRLEELRRRPDPPFLFAFSAKGGFVRTRDVYYLSATVEEGRIERGLDALLTEVERVDRHGFTATELARAKKDLLRQMEQAYRERDKTRSDTLAGEIMRHYLEEEPIPGIEVELELTRKYLDTIGLDEVNGLARSWIGDRNRVIAVNAPEKAGLATPTEAGLLEVFRAAESATIEPYVDRVRDEPLLEGEIRPGTVVAETSLAEIGAQHWRLSNGVQVVLKPTDFKNDEILLRGFSLGGSSLVAAEQDASASFATELAREGGLGKFDKNELEKALAGKIAGASVGIGELTETAQGRAAPEDLETMLQLLYLSFTAPRRDPDAIAAWTQRMRGLVENRRLRPETVFSDEWLLRMFLDHPRRQPFTEKTLDEIDVDAAFEIYAERFRDAGDFTFVLVGNFDPAEIRPLVCTYLGGLPTAGREERWRDVGVARSEGVVRFDVRKGLEPKSQVRLSFLGNAPWSVQAEHDLLSLANVLRIRLREVLREDKGATYGVGVFGSIAREPREEYSFDVSFGCAPENVDDLIAAVLAEIETLKRDGPAESYTQKVREGQLRKRETDLKENGFWLGWFLYAYRNGLDPRLVLDFDDLVQSVTPERMRDAAQRYLDDERYVLGVLYPEEPAPATD